MVIKTAMRVLFGMLVISVWVLGSSIQAGAETMHYKFYTWVIKSDIVPFGDVERHTVDIMVRGAFYVFDSGEIATIKHVGTHDLIMGSGTFMQYVSINFQDGSTIMIKSEGTTVGGSTPGVVTAGGWKSEIIKGTGRFEGLKGTQSASAKYLPVEPGEAGPKGYGEGTITYTLPSK